MKEAQITLSPKKCHFAYTSILLWGQKVSHLGLSTHAEKVRAIMELVAPSNVHTQQSFPGMAVYFSHYIPRGSWGRDQKMAFHSTQNALVSAPILGHPMQGQPLRVYSDASDIALGACLSKYSPSAWGT